MHVQYIYMSLEIKLFQYFKLFKKCTYCVDVGLDILFWVMSSSQKIIVSLKAKHKIIKFNILFVTIRCEIEGVFVISKHKKVTGNVFVSNKAACVYTVSSGVFSWSHTTTIIVTLLREVLLYLSPKRYNLRCFEWIHPVIHKEGGHMNFLTFVL